MNYRIDWTASAHDRLERIWMAAENTDVITSVADRIDRLLAEDPYRREAIVLGDENTLIVEPLAVDYEVLEDQKRVLIVGVWMIGYLETP